MAEQTTQSVPLPPGATIGVLGSGQLGRMLAMAAARLGLRVHIYADGRGPACDVAASTTIAPYDDVASLDAFARGVSAVTYEFENVAEGTVRHLSGKVPVRPGVKALAVAQDRLVEKTFIRDLGIAVAPFIAIDSADDLAAAMADDRSPAILKTRRLGYDGKGQFGIRPGIEAGAAMRAVGGAPAILERRLTFARELSVLICRAADGHTVAYDMPENTHRDGILRRSVVPAPALSDDVAACACAIATRIAEALDYVGLLAVELFDLGSAVALPARIVVNEIAPRVHNSGHWTIDACMVSQFENHMRAVAGWPLGSGERHSNAVMDNLIGQDVTAWERIAAEARCCLHLYGKHEARDGRKMGHVTRLAPRD